MCRKDLRPSFIPLPFARCYGQKLEEGSRCRKNDDIKVAGRTIESHLVHFLRFSSFFFRSLLANTLIEWLRDHGYFTQRPTGSLYEVTSDKFNSKDLETRRVCVVNIFINGVFTREKKIYIYICISSRRYTVSCQYAALASIAHSYRDQNGIALRDLPTGIIPRREPRGR